MTSVPGFAQDPAEQDFLNRSFEEPVFGLGRTELSELQSGNRLYRPLHLKTLLSIQVRVSGMFFPNVLLGNHPDNSFPDLSTTHLLFEV